MKPFKIEGEERKHFLILIFLAAMAAIAGIPYTLELVYASHRNISSIPFALQAFVEQLFISAIAIVVGIKLGPRTGLQAIVLTNWRSSIVITIIIGVFLAIATNLIGNWMESSLLDEWPEEAKAIDEAASQISAWKIILVSLSAGVIEELLFRFCALTLIVWSLRFFLKSEPQAWGFWIANLIAAILFGLIHLSNAIEFGIPITTGLIVYVGVINCSAGLIFGWLYWRRGIGHAMVAHAATDITLKSIIPALWS